jgi:hypothetical protein
VIVREPSIDESDLSISERKRSQKRSAGSRKSASIGKRSLPVKSKKSKPVGERCGRS